MKKTTTLLTALSIVLTVLLAISLALFMQAYGRLRLADTRENDLQNRLQALEAYKDQLQTQLYEALDHPKKEPAALFAGADHQTATQGDILSVVFDAAGAEGTPMIETDLGTPHFVKNEDGTWTAYVSVGFAQTPGDYDIKVTLGETECHLAVTVLEKEYGEQHMTMSAATAAATAGASGASEDYAQKIKSHYQEYEDKLLWEGLFLQPVQGRITTQFGLYRYTTYTDGTSRTTRHTGIDIACPEGTPVPASNSGKVVFSGDVITTGKTVVIEHGAGLKTYYFHLSELSCQTGDLVEKGREIGKVGSTGYSTGPHLHFEVMIGEYSLNPWVLFDGTSRIYSR